MYGDLKPILLIISFWTFGVAVAVNAVTGMCGKVRVRSQRLR